MFPPRLACRSHGNGWEEDRHEGRHVVSKGQLAGLLRCARPRTWLPREWGDLLLAWQWGSSPKLQESWPFITNIP